jgi:CMP-N-acetylneuraminic acid synthetase
MRIVGVIPARLGTDKVPFQNIKELGGIPLVNYTVRAMNKVKSINDIFIFASEPTICDYIYHGLKYKYMERPKHLDSPEATTQDIIAEFLKRDNADIIVLWHITAPFLKHETIVECIEKVKSGENNSAFTALEIRKFCWFRGKPLNYSLSQPTPRTQDIDPIIVEKSALYVFRREVFEKTGQRINHNPYIKVIDHFEGHEIDSPQDFKIAELIVNTGFFDLD